MRLNDLWVRDGSGMHRRGIVVGVVSVCMERWE